VIDNNKVDTGVFGKEIIGLGIAKIDKIFSGLVAVLNNLFETVGIGFIVAGVGTGNNVRETAFQTIVFKDFH
jgi:hypothetical protein